MKKKGQVGGASTILLVLAIAVVLYVLLVPEDTRQDILNESDSDYTNGENNGYDDPTDSSSRTILKKEPGALNEKGREDFHYSVPPITLSLKSSAEVITEENSFSVVDSWSKEKNKELEFNIDNLEKIEDDLTLTFNKVESSGKLKIKLNNKTIFENEVKKYNSPTIKLKKADLREGLNKLSFSVSSVGIKFWKTNEYSVRNLKIMGKVKDLSKQSSMSTFNIPKDRNKIESATLRFIPQCEQGDVGKLRAEVNGRELFYGTPDCKYLNKFDFPASYLNTGINKVRFKTEEGTYLIDRIRVYTKLQEITYPTYYFNIDDDQWEDITESDKIANMSLDFVVPEHDYIEMKVSINNDDVGIYQRNETFWEPVGDLLEKGNNVIKLIPEDEVDVINFKVEIDDVDEDDDDDEDNGDDDTLFR